MKTISLLALVTTSGCMCGSYAGAGDGFYMRDNETLTTCGQGGVVISRASGVIEGVFSAPTSGSQVLMEGATGARVTSFVALGDGTVMTPELGDEPWQPVVYTITERDHADIPCQDLHDRLWWGIPALHVPVDTAFSTPNVPAIPGGEPCGRGGPTPSCTIELDLCADGRVALARDGGVSAGGFAIDFGDVTGSFNGADGKLIAFTGTYTDDGILATTDLIGGDTEDLWTRIPPDPTKSITNCR